MKKYKGYYIDGIIFHNEAEIDAFHRQSAINSYRLAVELFALHPTMECSLYAEERADRLHDIYGMDWSKIEAIELEVLKNQ